MDRMLSRACNRAATLTITAVILASVLPAVAGSGDGYGPGGGDPGAASAAKRNAYTVTPLVSDGFIPAPATDANLLNAWGIAASGGGPWWVADNHSDKSTIYDGDGTIQGLVVSIPDDPTGIVFNGTASDFMVSDGVVSGKAIFIFAGEGGT